MSDIPQESIDERFRNSYKGIGTEALLKIVQGSALLDVYRGAALVELVARGMSKEELAPYALQLRESPELRKRQQDGELWLVDLFGFFDDVL